MTEEENLNMSGEIQANRINFLVKSIEEHHKIIDRRLTRPAPWYGLARRELEGREDPEVRRRVGIAYNNLIEKSQEAHPLNVDLMLSVHKDLQEDGGQFRRRGVKVGRDDPVRRPHSSKVPELVMKALARASDGVEQPPLAAARLHLELLIIHPFSDSNGRVARLMASYVLMCAGYYSSLLASVEQHFQVQPRAYARSFRILRDGGERKHALWLITALEAMLFNSVKATWFRLRQDKLYSTLELSESSDENWIQLAIDYDLSRGNNDATILSDILGETVTPIIEQAEEMQVDELSALISQVERLYIEETNETDEPDRYTKEVLDALKNIKNQ